MKANLIHGFGILLSEGAAIVKEMGKSVVGLSICFVIILKASVYLSAQ